MDTEWSQARIENLVTSQVAESMHFEFKREPYVGDSGKNELRKDVSAFANAEGGCLVIGIEEKDEVAVGVSPIASLSPGEHQIRVQNILSSGFDPSLHAWEVHIVEFDAGHVLVVDVSRSPNGPHRVIAGGKSRFYKRAGCKVYEPSTGELREMMSFYDSALRRFDGFRRARVEDFFQNKIGSSQQKRGVSLLAHIAPASFSEYRMLDISAADEHCGLLRPTGSGSSIPSYNADGFLVHVVRRDGTSIASSQLFRNARAELMFPKIDQKTPYFPVLVKADFICERVCDWVRRLTLYFSRVGVVSPYFVGFSLSGAKGARVNASNMADGELMESNVGAEIGTDFLHFPICQVEGGELSSVEEQLSASLDALWQTGGKSSWPKK
jgi:hypothetical protein